MPVKKIRGTLDGLPIIDATEPLMIEVLPADINYRRRKDPEHCAIAEACVRDLQCRKARVHMSRLYIHHGSHWLRYMLPENARVEIVAFDRGGTFSPGTYRLRPVQPSHRSGAAQQGGGARKKKKGTIGVRSPSRDLGVRAKSPVHGNPSE